MPTVNVLMKEAVSLAITTHCPTSHATSIVKRSNPTQKLRLQTAQVRTHMTTDSLTSYQCLIMGFQFDLPSERYVANNIDPKSFLSLVMKN